MSSVVKAPFIRSPYNYDRAKASDEAALPASEYGESLTIQSMKDDADLNVIMRRFGITGMMPENPRVPMYGDFTEVGDFRSALHAVQQAQEQFMEFPAELRARFSNDPQQLLEFVADDRNMAEAVRLGLVAQPEAAGAAKPVGGSLGEPVAPKGA